MPNMILDDILHKSLVSDVTVFVATIWGYAARNQLVAKFSRLYAQAAPEDQLALRVWMRDIILGRKVGSANTVRARRVEKRMVAACERRILEFPLGMDAREVAKELKREGWYAWASDYESIASLPAAISLLGAPSSFCTKVTAVPLSTLWGCQHIGPTYQSHGCKTGGSLG
jgi:hypothetical protein